METRDEDGVKSSSLGPSSLGRVSSSRLSWQSHKALPQKNCLQVEVEQALVADVSLALDVVLSWCGDYPGLERLYCTCSRGDPSSRELGPKKVNSESCL